MTNGPQNIAYSDSEKANVFNDVFVNQNTSTSSGTFPIRPTPVSKTFNFTKLLAADVEKVVRTLPNKMSCGTDGISYKLEKEVGHGIVGPLTSLFNHSLRLRRIPEEWKNAVVTPIFKGGRKDRHHPTNYRPISLTSCVARIIKKLLDAQILEYLQSTSLLYKHQSGSPRQSTVT